MLKIFVFVFASFLVNFDLDLLLTLVDPVRRVTKKARPFRFNFSIFMQFLGKIWPNHMLAPLPSAPHKKSTHF